MKKKIRVYGERAIRGAIAALVGVYLAGNLVFDTTDVSGSVWHIVTIAIGGAASALGLSGLGQLTTKNGPSFNSVETTK